MGEDAICIDVDGLRWALAEEAGTAAFSGVPTAAADLLAIEAASPDELVQLAEQLGIDWRRFVVH